MNDPAVGAPPSSRAQALEALRQKIHSPEGDKEDVEALLGVLRQPVEPGQDVRGLAEELNHLIEDPLLCALRGEQGERVDAVTVRALVALGEPHASTLSEKALAVLERERPASHAPVPREAGGGKPVRRVRRDVSPRQEAAPEENVSFGGALAVCCFVLAGCEFLFTLTTGRGDDESRGSVLLFTLLTLVVPGLVFTRPAPRLVYSVTSLLLLIVSVLMALPLLFFLYKLYAPSWALTEILVTRATLVLALFIAALSRGEKRGA